MATNNTTAPETPAGDTPSARPPDAQTAADLIREKVSRIYNQEPSAVSELAEATSVKHRSAHQEFMHQLSTSGKDLATIQTEWHNYYQGLPDDQKHQVWHEFYASQSVVTGRAEAASDPQKISEHKQHAVKHSEKAKKYAARPRKLREARSTKEVQAAIRDKVSAGGKLETKHHLQSLLFGLGMGLIVVVIFLFGFFNEVFLAPFIQPSRTASATPLIINGSTTAASTTPEVIIPKINVEIPADYSQTSIDENVIENALENGVVHYPTTAVPGQNGNTAFFGHSSNNIFNKGKYKFAFVLLHTLVPGDTFYLSYNGKVYAYKVISRTIVDPSNVSVLDAVPGQTATATLITCDPPGTSLKRLVVVGQQISPDPTANTKAAAAPTATTDNTPTSLPGNGPTLWGRFISTVIGKTVTAALLIAALVLVIRWMNAPLRERQRSTS
jgi:LPXTG-site transpeptidase (sortase) family protein